jgi:cell division protein FtsZ
VLLSISGGSDLGLFEINEAAQLVAEAAHQEANIIFGAVIDDALGDEVRVTVIAAGFDGGTPRRAVPAPARRTEPADRTLAAPQPETRSDATGTSFERSDSGALGGTGDRVPEPAMAGSPRAERPAERRPDSIEVGREPAATRSRTIVFDDSDDLDVPDFLK